MPSNTLTDHPVQCHCGEVQALASSSALPEALRNFDSLPDAANVRQPVVEGLFDISGPTVWRWVKSGLLPEPRKQSKGVTTWNVGELRRRLASRGA